MHDSNQYVVYVAELSGGLVAGWIGAYVFRSLETGSCAEINGLVIDERIRSGGIGKVLVRAIEEWARSVGCDAISVRSNIMRERAHRFYTRNGYELVKTQKAFRKNFRAGENG
jgi:GNAT superfamily N-acetyltransferase